MIVNFPILVCCSDGYKSLISINKVHSYVKHITNYVANI